MRTGWKGSLPVSATFLLPFLVGMSVHRQGFNLLDDGLWLLGTRILAEGGTLYGDVFSIYGPARYFLLMPFFLILGKSALALAVFKALLDGSASLFGYLYTRRLGAGAWAWLVPLGVVAIGPVHPRYLAAALFAAFVGWILVRPVTSRWAAALGLAWGGLCLFGLDMAGYGAAILLVGWIVFRRRVERGKVRPTLPAAGIAVGLVVVLGTATLVCLVSGVLGAAFWDTVVYPVTRFGDAMGVSWYESFLHDSLLDDPFSGHFTGEDLAPAWPGHGSLRALGFRAMFILVWLIPPAFLWSLRRSADARQGPLLALVLAGWVTLLARGDVFHLRLVWFGTLLAVPLLIARAPGGRVVRGALAALFCLVVIGPLFGEQVWLATHLGRPGLVRWERPAADVHLEKNRAMKLESLCSELDWDGRSPVLVWPAQPGLQFVLGAPLPTAQATLLGAEVRSPATVIADLEEHKPPVAILGLGRGLVAGVTHIQGLAPTLWSYLRRHYLLANEYATEYERYQTAVRAPETGAGSPGRKIEARLPGAAQEKKNSASPALGPGVAVAQSFKVDDFDLGGLALMFKAPGPFPYRISPVMTIFEKVGFGKPRLLRRLDLNVTLNQATQKILFSFEPVPDTAGKKLLVVISGHPEGTRPFGLLWNKSTGESAEFVDYYPEGQAFFNHQPVQADLYFISY
ncbi:MAG: hypothetical protein ABFS42_11880 [Candidatus Krumholzibacteriota bacterium]